MELYKSRSSWTIMLALFGLIIIVITSFYSYYLAKNLADKEQNSVELIAQALDQTLNSDVTNQENLILQGQIIQFNTVPIVLSYPGQSLKGNNFGIEKDTNQVFLQKQIDKSLAKGFEPIIGGGYSIYLNHSKLYNLIRIYPFIQFFLVTIFIFLGYLVFSASRKDEQSKVWAGMAKETAHQLGTPITAILAWLEHLKLDSHTSADQLDIIHELENDVERLDLIADRFSKIGSKPRLEQYDLYKLLDDNKNYMQKRAARKIKFNFPSPEEGPLLVNINEHLFSWVIENLMRNALDAMEGIGEISAVVNTNQSNVVIELSDTGKGISESKFKTVFKPGFSTKTRGWGLGLSLAKRIIEDYHRGKIFVKNSKLNEGTTFAISLPRTD